MQPPHEHSVVNFFSCPLLSIVVLSIFFSRLGYVHVICDFSLGPGLSCIHTSPLYDIGQARISSRGNCARPVRGGSSYTPANGSQVICTISLRRISATLHRRLVNVLSYPFLPEEILGAQYRDHHPFAATRRVQNGGGRTLKVTR